MPRAASHMLPCWSIAGLFYWAANSRATMSATNIAGGCQTFKPLDADEAVDGVQLGAQLRGQLKVNGLLAWGGTKLKADSDHVGFLQISHCNLCREHCHLFRPAQKYSQPFMTRQADSIQLMATPHTLRRRLVVPSTTCAALGERRLPHELQFQNTTVGGLSGVDYDPASGTYCLLSDESGYVNPPRFCTARTASTADQFSDIKLTAVIFLQATGAPDPEAIRWHPPSQSLLWTSEGNAVRNAAPNLQRTRHDGSPKR